MRYFVFGYMIDSIQHELIKKMLDYLTKETYKIIDLRSYSIPEIEENDAIITYGAIANRLIKKDIKCKLRLELPELYVLDPVLGDEKERKRVKQEFIQLKKTLDSGNMEVLPSIEAKEKETLLTGKLPSQLTAKKVQELEKQQIEKNISYWSGWTVDGKSIRVTIEPEENYQADINLTFAELYAVLGLKEIFQVEEVEIVHKPSDSSRKTHIK